ncbi:MAG: efflux RND transporter periplasmic adaptor subunit, partial [Desulfamplus sp.]|nr:efflux RND transporter periplasmic adaptor subunit [Desulfamplus sp.]
MDKNIDKRETIGFPFKAVIITALITALAFSSLFYLMGFHPSHPEAGLGYKGAAQTDLEAHDHSKDDAMTEDLAQLWTCGMHPWVITQEPGLCPICNMDLIPKRGASEAASSSGGQIGERKIVYWKAPMDPTEIYNQPGKSKMGMDLVPVYEDQLVGGVDVSIDPVTEQNMGVRMEPVEEGQLTNTIRTYGHSTYD